MSGLFGTLFWFCLVLYALAVAGQIYGHVFGKQKWVERATWAIALGLALHTVLVAWRWVETGHVPTIGNFENALVGGWFIVAMTLWASWKQRYPLLAAGALPFALLILGGGALSDTSAQPMVAALQSFWLYIHIFFAWLAYGAYTVACGAGIVYLVKSLSPTPS
jgi:ABC-type transport system involved in cytochrome c biogenesis permease subunit